MYMHAYDDPELVISDNEKLGLFICEHKKPIDIDGKPHYDKCSGSFNDWGIFDENEVLMNLKHKYIEISKLEDAKLLNKPFFYVSIHNDNKDEIVDTFTEIGTDGSLPTSGHQFERYWRIPKDGTTSRSGYIDILNYMNNTYHEGKTLEKIQFVVWTKTPPTYGITCQDINAVITFNWQDPVVVFEGWEEVDKDGNLI